MADLSGILKRVQRVTMLTAVNLKQELRRITKEKELTLNMYGNAEARIREMLTGLGSSTDGRPKTTTGTRHGKRLRRSPEQLRRDAEAVFQFIKRSGSEGAKGRDIRRSHPKVGLNIKKYVQKYSDNKVKTTGAKTKMRYFPG